MKTKLAHIAFLLAFVVTPALAHEGIELGPNGGRILEFSKNETMHGEVTAKNGTFHIAVLDKDMKPVGIDKQTLAVTSGDRDNPQKLPVEVKDNHFTVPMLKGDDYHLIFQFKPESGAKAVTARLHYDASICECKAPEWLCACPPATKDKK